MESPPSVFFRMHWDHEPETRKPFRIKASVFRFMESPLSSVRMHWDLEPTPNPSQEGSRTAWPVPLLGGVRGGFVARRFMESLLSLLRMHWDHEVAASGSGAAVPAAGAGVSPAMDSRARRPVAG